MVIKESYKLGGYVVGIGKIHIDGTEEFEWLDKPKHNRIMSGGLDHLLTFEGNDEGGYTLSTMKDTGPALWLGKLESREGALTYCKIGTNGAASTFNDTDLKTPVTDYSDTHRTGSPFTGTKVTDYGYNLRVTYVSKPVVDNCTIKEVGIFGKYTKDTVDVYPMFARVVLDTAIALEAGESLTFTYQLNVEVAYKEEEETNKFFNLIDDQGEDLYYAKKAYFTYNAGTDPYTDTLKNTLYIDSNATEQIYNSNGLAGCYFLNYMPYYYHNYNNYGGFDSIGFSTESQSYTMPNERLSIAKKLKGDYDFSFTDYKCRETNRKYRDVVITMGIMNPDFEDPADYLDIKFFRIRGMNYKFGYYNTESEEHEWIEQSLRKWASQTLTFTIRTEYITEDNIDIENE